MLGLKIVSTGGSIAKNCVTNEDLSKFVDTNDEWIVSRTGIEQRYFDDGGGNVELASKAAQQALDRAKIDKNDIACCLVATFTPDGHAPSVACGVHGKLGLSEDIVAYDINGACAGFMYGLATAYGFLLQQPEKYALVIGSEIISRVLDFDDRATCVLFGDGAGAAVVKLSDSNKFCFSSGTRSNKDVLHCTAVHNKQRGAIPSIMMNGKEVFRFAVEIIPKCMNDLLEKASCMLEDIDYVVCHQANLRIISNVYKRLNAPKEKFFINLNKYGNTSAASIPIALNEMWEKGLLKDGKKLLCVGFGAGLTWAGVYLEF